jgi:FKBP12-rapamycin complex-associated protein
MDPFLKMIQTCPPSALEFHLNQLGILVSLIKSKIDPYLIQVLGLIKEFWSIASPLQLTILSLIEAIAQALAGELREFMHMILPDLLKLLENDSRVDKSASLKALSVLVVLDTNIEEYLHLAVPSLVKVLERGETIFMLKRATILTIGMLCKRVNFTDFASRIILPLVRLLNSSVVVSAAPVKGKMRVWLMISEL